MPKLNPERLLLLRQFHDLTQSELGTMVAVSQPTIADYEAGKKEPQSSVVDALALVLRVDPAFFFQADDEVFREPEYNFRRDIKAGERTRRKVIAQANLFGILVRAIRAHVPMMPKVNVPHFSGGSLAEIEEAAAQTRQHWRLGLEGPIHSMTETLESAGVVLTIADAETANQVDAFSRYGKTSVVVLNAAKGSTSRSFFDAAHEAAHGVLHHERGTKDLITREEEAQQFAGAFLMPRRPFTREFWARGSVDWANLLELKERWGTSIASILVRAFEVGLIDVVTYRTAYRELVRRGWQTSEPDEPEPETPSLFRLALEQYEKRVKRPLDAFVAETHFSPILFSAVSGVSPAPSKNKSVVSLTERRKALAR